MARLKAIFDIEDRMTRRLKRITGDLERVRRVSERPMVITATDRATRVAKRVAAFIGRDIAKTHQMVIRGRDMVTNHVLRPLSSYMQRRFPSLHNMTIQGIDRATPVVQRIQRMTRGALLGSYMMTILAKDAATPIINRITQFAKASFHRGFTLSVRTLDLASNGLRNISNFARSAVNRTYTITVRVLDLATRPLRAIANLATSTLGVLGAAGGVYGGVVAPLNMVMDRQSTTTAFEVLLGSAEAAYQRVEELTQFAGQTPFARDEIFKASRVLQTFTGNALSTGDGLRLIGDVAAGTQHGLEETAMWFGRLYDGMASGRPIGDATSRLQEMGAISGAARARLEKLAESGRDISEIWPLATKEFERFNGMMLKLSDNLQNLLLGTKQFFVQNMFMRWGMGLEKALTPALSAFRDWRNENSAAIAVMGDQFERLGERATNAVLNPLRRIASFAGKQFQILFPEDGDYSEMSFRARVDLVINNTSEVFNDWWVNTGKAQAENIGSKIGQTYGGILRGGITGLLGIETDENINPFVDAGVTAGRGFVEGFLEALNPADLTIGIMRRIGEINANALGSVWGRITGNEELANSGSVSGAVVTNLLALAAASKIITSVLPAGKGLFKAGKGLLTGAGNLGRGVITTISGRRANRQEPLPPLRTPGETRQSRGMPRGLTRGLSKIPFVGTAIAGLGLASMSRDELPGGIGSVAGGLGGASAGAAIGSIVPGIGTAVGGIIGGILGSIGGGALGKWLGNLDWGAIGSSISSSISNGFNNTIETIQNAWNSFTTWFSDSVWTPISDVAASASESIRSGWNSLTTWFNDSVWTPLKNEALNVLDFFIGVWDIGEENVRNIWSAVSTWFTESVWTPLSEGASAAIDRVSLRFNEGWNWITEGWGMLSSWFQETIFLPLSEAAAFAATWLSTQFNAGLTWIQETWATATTWFQETIWTPLSNAASVAGIWISTKFSEAWAWIQGVWGTVSGWFQETVWTPLTTGITTLKTSFDEKFQAARDTAQEVWGAVSGWFEENVWSPIISGVTTVTDAIVSAFETAWGTVSSIWNGITGAWNSVSGFVGGIVERGRSRRTGGNNNQTPAGLTEYARGGLITRPHMGLVGEAGPEMIIPLSSGHRSRALRLWKQAGEILGVNSSGSVQLPQEQVQAAQRTSNQNTQSNGRGDIYVQFTGENHYHNEMDAEKVSKIAVEAVRKALDDDDFEGGTIVVD